MSFRTCMQEGRDILMEGALGERLKREYGLKIDGTVAMASLVYTQEGRQALAALWEGYAEIARRYQMPFIATTPTRRANRERIEQSGHSEAIFRDNVEFLRELQKNSGIEMYIGGLMGCKGDAYTGEGALSEEEAVAFHRWTAEHFRDAGVDFLYAGIMPVLSEAAGLARAVDETGVPYIISFTIRKDGKLIDGTSVADAIRYIDGCTENKPLCYMANCVHPSIVRQAMAQPFNAIPLVRERFRGIQANTSPLSYEELDQAQELHCSPPEELAEEMMKLGQEGNIRIWGGCCGTDDRHMACIAQSLKQR